MKQNVLAAALLMSCSALAGCSDKVRIATAIKPPAERLACESAGARPVIPAEHAVDWSAAERAGSVAEAVKIAKGEVARLVASIRTREGKVAGYIVKLEGVHFVCSINAAWLRDFFAGLPAGTAQR